MGFRLPLMTANGPSNSQYRLASMPRDGGASTLSDSCESLSLDRRIGAFGVQSISIGVDSRRRGIGGAGGKPRIAGLRLGRRAAAQRQRQQPDDLDAFADRQH